MVELARWNAASVLHDFASATASAELLAHTTSLNAVLLAHRALKNRFEAFRAEVASATVASDLRMDLRPAALASAHDMRITALAARPSGLTTFVASLALLDTRVTSLEAASADLWLDLPPPDGAIVSYLKNVMIAGKRSRPKTSSTSGLRPGTRSTSARPIRWRAIRTPRGWLLQRRCLAHLGHTDLLNPLNLLNFTMCGWDQGNADLKNSKRLRENRNSLK